MLSEEVFYTFIDNMCKSPLADVKLHKLCSQVVITLQIVVGQMYSLAMKRPGSMWFWMEAKKGTIYFLCINKPVANTQPCAVGLTANCDVSDWERGTWWIIALLVSARTHLEILVWEVCRHPRSFCEQFEQVKEFMLLNDIKNQTWTEYIGSCLHSLVLWFSAVTEIRARKVKDVKLIQKHNRQLCCWSIYSNT